MSIVYCRDFKVQFKQRTFLLKNLSHDDFKTIKEVVVYFLKNYNHNTTHKLKSAEIHHKTVTNHYYICSTASDFDSRVTKTGSSENENELTEEREISFNIPFATSPRAFAIYPLHENTQKPRKLYTKKIDVLVHSSRDSSVSSATMSGGTPPVPVVPLKRKRGRPPKVRPAETAERPKTAPVTLVEVLPGNQRRSLSVDVDGRRRSSEHKKPHTTTPTIQEVRVRSSSVKEIEGTSDSEEGGRVKKGGVVSAALLQKKHKEKKRKTEEEDSTDSEHPYHPVANNEEYLREKKLREEAERARLLKKQTEENNATYRRQIKYFMNEHTTSHNNNHHNSNSDPPPPFVSDDLLQMGNRRDYYNQFYLNYFVKKSMLDPRNATTMKQALQETIETLKKKSPHPNTDYNAAFSEHKTKSLLLSSPESYLFNPFVQLYKPSEFYHHPHPKKSVLLPIVVGSCVEYVSREEEQRSHQWTVYVRGLFNGKYSHTSSDHYLSKCIEKVVFVLDKSFANPIRVVTEMPFEVTERGWGEFAVGVHVYLKVNREEGLGAKDILKFRTGVSRGVPHGTQAVFKRYHQNTYMTTKPDPPENRSRISFAEGIVTTPPPPANLPGTSTNHTSNNTASSISFLTDVSNAGTQNNQILAAIGNAENTPIPELNYTSWGRQLLYRSPYLPLHLMSCPGPHRPHHPHQSICSSSDDSDSEEENQHRSKRVKMEQGKSAHPIKTEAEEDMVPPTEDGFDFRSFYDSFNGSGAPLCFSHALRFSHRQSPHPNIPPSEENRLKHNTTGSTRDGYLLVADPVVTEHYEEIEIPLYSSIHRTEEEKELLSVVSQLEQYLRLFLYEKQKLTLLLLHRNLLSDQYDKSHPLANLNAHPSSTAVREEKERISNRFNYKHLSTIDRSSDATSGVKGGVSCFDKIYRYGDVESKDYFHSMSYLSSTAAVAREEGWLVPRLAALRRTLFPTTHKDEEAFLVSFTSTKSEDQPKTGFKAEPQTEEGTLLLDPHSLASWTAVTTAPASPEYNAVLSQSNFYRPPTTASHTHLLSELEYDIISFLLLFSSDASLFYYYQQCLSVVGEELSVLVDVAQRQHEPNSSPSAYLPVHPSIYKEVPSPTLTHAVPPNPAENNNNNNKYEDMSNRFYFLNGIALTNEKKANFSHFNDIIKLKQFRKELLTEIDKMNKIISHKKVIETLQSL